MVSGVQDLLAKMRTWFGSIFDVGPEDRLKIIFLSIAYFLVIGAYTIARELKDSIFLTVVGKAYQPRAKLLVMVVLVPVILFYSLLVDRVKRHQLLALCSAFFGLGGLCVAYFLGDPTIGLYNTVSSPYRFFGWIFYVFVEGYSPFLVSVLWAFANSITSPESAKNNYALVVAASKVGGVLTSGMAWFLFTAAAGSHCSPVFAVKSHQMVLFVASIMLLLVPLVIWLMTRMVPSSHLHGYEAAYQAEKQLKKEHKESVGMFAGLSLLGRYPYVMGIFSMIVFYEIINTVLSFLRLGVAQQHSSDVAGISGYLFKIIFMTHLVGFFISLFGTKMLLKRLGEKTCLMIVPLLIGALLLGFMLYPVPDMLVMTFVALKAINYAFSWPVRESLYIPTVKDIKFKSRSWIDAFGGKFAKMGGALFNEIVMRVGEAVLAVYSLFFASIVFCWFTAAFLLGRRFESAVANNEVIGIDKQAPDPEK